MDDFEQSDLEKEINNSDNTFYQNAIHNKWKGNAFIKKLQVWYIFFCLCYESRDDWDLFSWTTENRQEP